MSHTPTHKVWYSFLQHPVIKFENQGANEQIILLVRGHPITQIPWIINGVGIVLLVFLLNLFLPSFVSLNAIIFINVFGLVVAASYVFYNFLNWYFNVGIVTNERIVDVDFHYILYKEVTATKIQNVQDVTSKSGGFVQSFFNYGDVFVQTAGTEVNIEFQKVPLPSDVVHVINNLLAN